jgi:hypothetical protein
MVGPRPGVLLTLLLHIHFGYVVEELNIYWQRTEHLRML